ncbi:hypothetical protein [Inquilinus ginsengisoli]|uniref:hypothetical protein n=1 Tax=Inquilinus ginsengisoli TaxID=363840 RepID=UPI003D1EA9E4
MGHIIGTTSRLPFTAFEVKILIEAMENGRSKGRDLALHPVYVNNFEEVVSEGVIALSSPLQLQRDFVFVKVNAGRGFFGRQKAGYASFIGSVMGDEFTPGAVFKSWMVAATSIGNVYRGMGLR